MNGSSKTSPEEPLILLLRHPIRILLANLLRVIVRAGEERSGVGTLVVALWGSPAVCSGHSLPWSCGVVRLQRMTFPIQTLQVIQLIQVLQVLQTFMPRA